MLESYQPLQACPQVEYGESSFQMRTSNGDRKIFRSYQFEVSNLVPEMADLGFVRETLIFETWNFKLLIGKKRAYSR